LLLAGLLFVIMGSILMALGDWRRAARTVVVKWRTFVEITGVWASDIRRMIRAWVPNRVSHINQSITAAP
jgi:hypothetical protein